MTRPVEDIVTELQSLRDGHAAAHLLKDTSAERRVTRTEQGDPVRAAQADALGAVVMSKAGEEAWRTGTVVEVLAPAPPAFTYDGRMSCTCTTLSFKVEDGCPWDGQDLV